MYDNGYYYQWAVKVCENETVEEYCSEWTSARIINITSFVSINITNDFVDFGDMNIDESKNTTQVGLNPLSLENNGNSLVNISMNATQLWDSINYEASEYFQSKVGDYTGKAKWAETSWFQLPPITGLIVVVDSLNYSDESDDLDFDVLLKVPGSEPGGAKSSIINFRASLSE